MPEVAQLFRGRARTLTQSVVTSKPGLEAARLSNQTWSRDLLNVFVRFELIWGQIQVANLPLSLQSQLTTEVCLWGKTGPPDLLCSRMSLCAGGLSLLEGPSASVSVRSWSFQILTIDACSLGSPGNLVHWLFLISHIFFPGIHLGWRNLQSFLNKASL